MSRTYIVLAGNRLLTTATAASGCRIHFVPQFGSSVSLEPSYLALAESDLGPRHRRILNRLWTIEQGHQ
jgi:hypothetical protein